MYVLQFTLANRLNSAIENVKNKIDIAFKVGWNRNTQIDILPYRVRKYKLKCKSNNRTFSPRLICALIIHLYSKHFHTDKEFRKSAKSPFSLQVFRCDCKIHIYIYFFVWLQYLRWWNTDIFKICVKSRKCVTLS